MKHAKSALLILLVTGLFSLQAPSTAVGQSADRLPTVTQASVGEHPVAAKKKKGRYKPEPGYTFTAPSKNSQGIIEKVLRAINHSQKGSKIRMMSWNFDSYRYVGALKAAHNRGVSVRIIMARSLFNEQGAGGPAKTMARALKFNGNRDADMRSWLRTCQNSCRGKGGAMHSKFYIFSKTGAAKDVVMATSANLTAASGRVQWNDMYTLVDRPVSYDGYNRVFTRAIRDRPDNFFQVKDGDFTSFFYPLRRQPDNVMGLLEKVRCSGAKGAGINGRTSVLVAQDVFNQNRGVRIARKLVSLHRSGCVVKVVFSQAVGGSGSIIAQLPNNHLVADRDGDGAYDIYLHTKSMAISGNFNGQPDARIVLGGASGNFSAVAAMSDEQGMIITKPHVEKAYGKWINSLMNIHLHSVPRNPLLPRAVDPYMNMEQ